MSWIYQPLLPAAGQQQSAAAAAVVKVVGDGLTESVLLKTKSLVKT